MPNRLHLALGDSITVGYDATHVGHSYIHHVSRALIERQLADQTIIIAKNGWTSANLAQAITNLPHQVFAKTTLATLLIGGNDLRHLVKQMMTRGPAAIEQRRIDVRVAMFAQNYRYITSILANRVPKTIAMTVYNPIPNEPLAVRAFQDMNKIIRETAKEHRFKLVDVYGVFDGQQDQFIHRYQQGRLADLMKPFRRPIHPNNYGHARLAQAVIAALPSKVKQTE